MIRMVNVWVLCALVASVGRAEEKKAEPQPNDPPLKTVHLLNLPDGVTESDLGAVLIDVNQAIAKAGYPESGYRFWKIKSSNEKMEYQYLWEGNWPSQAGYDAIHKLDAFRAAWKAHSELYKKLSGHLYIRYAEVPLQAGKTAHRAKTHPVTGTVTLDGQPVEGATVSFQMDGKSKAVGVTNDRGEYALSTSEPNDGVPAGQYMVTIAKNDPATQKNLLPMKYADARTTGITVQVSESGINKFNFELASR